MKTQNDINNFFEREFKDSLYVLPSEKFTDKIMEKIQMQEKYAQEEVKTDRFVWSVTLVVILFICSVSGIFVFLYSIPTNDKVSEYSETVKTFIVDLSDKIYNFLGNGSPIQSFITILLIIFFVLGYMLIDKKVFKNG